MAGNNSELPLAAPPGPLTRAWTGTWRSCWNSVEAAGPRVSWPLPAYGHCLRARTRAPQQQKQAQNKAPLRQVNGSIHRSRQRPSVSADAPGRRSWPRSGPRLAPSGPAGPLDAGRLRSFYRLPSGYGTTEGCSPPDMLQFHVYS